MALLIAGVVLWSVAHLFPAIAPDGRTILTSKLGAGPYKGLFALDIVIALGLIIFGWKSSTPAMVYAVPVIDDTVPLALVILSIVLFVAASLPNNLKRYVRHPQMMAVVLWGASHLMTNGDSRSVVLFGGLTAWAILEVVFINRRDGAWQRPAAVPFVKDVVTGIVAIAAIAAIVAFHARLFGVPAL